MFGRPGRTLLIVAALCLLSAWPLWERGERLELALLLTEMLLVWAALSTRRWPGLLLIALGLAAYLPVAARTPGEVAGAGLFILAVLGAWLSRSEGRRAWLWPLAIPTVLLLAWAALGFQALAPWRLIYPAVGMLAVLLAGYSVSRLRLQRDELRTLTASLEAANAALRAQAAGDAELARLRERERLARELHDTLGHALSTLTVQQEAARRLLTRDPERAGAQLRDAQGLTRQAMSDLRAALDDLRAEAAPSLAALLRELTAPLAGPAGPSAQLELTDTPLSPQLLSALRPVLAEALMNVARHAQAGRVWVTASAGDGWLRLRVEDDGVGFDPCAVQPGHYGLRGLAERVAALDGHLALGRRPGGGSRMTLEVPLRAVPRPLPRVGA